MEAFDVTELAVARFFGLLFVLVSVIMINGRTSFPVKGSLGRAVFELTNIDDVATAA